MFKTNMRRKGVNVYSICSKVLDDENYDTKLSGNKYTNGLVRELALKAKQANVKDFIRKTYEWFIKVIPSELRSKFVDVMLHSPPSTSSSPSPLLIIDVFFTPSVSDNATATDIITLTASVNGVCC